MKKSHLYIFVNYRKLYVRTLAGGINHFNRSLVIINLLATGKHTIEEQRQEVGELIMVFPRAGIRLKRHRQ